MKDQNVNPSVVMCSAHTNMICDRFCETCAVDICIMCTIIGDHVDCDDRNNSKTVSKRLRHLRAVHMERFIFSRHEYLCEVLALCQWKSSRVGLVPILCFCICVTIG